MGFLERPIGWRLLSLTPWLPFGWRSAPPLTAGARLFLAAIALVAVYLDPDEPSVLVIKKRVRVIGGDLRIISGAGRAARLEIAWPLATRQPERAHV
jgi:hypothetical protein